ncbi:MAG TPA: CPBP family intramembrane glutamic endopeptidase [Mycobacteriales bacterium]|jgi:membrane protease YdiL (CAAX protease family)|nr:CPBP family intramembrane glutamic endopeptidase [Mycobacteriales bacterium]
MPQGAQRAKTAVKALDFGVDEVVMQTCAQCGSTSPAEAAWCGMCYLPFVGQSPAAAPVALGTLPPPSLPPQLPPPDPPTPQGAPPQLRAPQPPTLQWAPAQPAYAGWPSPAGPGWAPYQPPAPVDEDPGGRLLSKRAIAIVAIAIVLGGATQLAGYLLARDSSLSDDTLIRSDIVMTLTFYAVVAVLIVSQITPNVRLRWGEGPLLSRIGIGALCGLGLGGVLLALVSAAAGRLYPDPRIVQLMSAGDPAHVVVIAGLTMVAAPLVEETLFRGLLLESLRPRGTQVAIGVSAVAFAIWHFLPASLAYYVAMGTGLGLLYVKRGMASSMAAHACFNGVLTVAAIFVVLGPAHTYHFQGLSFTAPSGWTQPRSQTSPGDSPLLRLQGPSGSQVLVDAIDSTSAFDPDATAARLAGSAAAVFPGATIDPGSVQETQLPNVGTAVEVRFSAAGDTGEMVLFAEAGRGYGMVFINGGSTRAADDFTKMLQSLGPG